MPASRSTEAARPQTERPGKDGAGQGPRPGSLKSRFGWFVLLYLASAVAYAAAVYGLRALVPHP